MTATNTSSTQTSSARLWRMRLPANGSGHEVALSVRMDSDRETGEPRVWVAVGSRYRRLPLTVPEAWALFRLLAEALDTAGDPPEFIRTAIIPTEK